MLAGLAKDFIERHRFEAERRIRETGEAPTIKRRPNFVDNHNLRMGAPPPPPPAPSGTITPPGLLSAPGQEHPNAEALFQRLESRRPNAGIWERLRTGAIAPGTVASHLASRVSRPAYLNAPAPAPLAGMGLHAPGGRARVFTATDPGGGRLYRRTLDEKGLLPNIQESGLPRVRAPIPPGPVRARLFGALRRVQVTQVGDPRGR